MLLLAALAGPAPGGLSPLVTALLPWGFGGLFADAAADRCAVALVLVAAPRPGAPRALAAMVPAGLVR
ncbi:hypothetical protein [Nocardiopsis sp. RV163]|uniref:hypothetical protein n=1 Tax=Nocardiopsis sp. RV163 TaxID=1661388 RepID=UPI00064C3A2D|nr:hypothetical protein [Nocardiopsis sp. RV163]